MSKRNVEGLQEYGKVRTALSEKKVLAALNDLRKSSEDITVAKVAKTAGVSLNFIYSHEDILNTVKKYTVPSGRKKQQTQDSKDVIISCLRAEIKDLKKTIKEIESNENYKGKCESLEKEIDRLKDELEKAYNNNLDLTY